MAASPTERCWCVLEFAWCNSFVAVERAFQRQFGHRGPPETSIRRWYEQFHYRGCICHQGKGRAGRPSVTEETVDRVHETFTRSPRKSVRRASRELKIPEPTVRKILRKRQQLYPYKLQLVQSSSLMIHPSGWRFVRTCWAGWKRIRVRPNGSFWVMKLLFLNPKYGYGDPRILTLWLRWNVTVPKWMCFVPFPEDACSVHSSSWRTLLLERCTWTCRKTG